MSTPRPFLTVSEAAELLGSSPSTVSQAIESGKLPAVKLGETNASSRIPRAALFPDDQSVRDLRTDRMRRQFADVERKRELRDRLQRDFLDADRDFLAALRTLSDELAMQDVAAARDALRKAS